MVIPIFQIKKQRQSESCIQIVKLSCLSAVWALSIKQYWPLLLLSSVPGSVYLRILESLISTNAQDAGSTLYSEWGPWTSSTAASGSLSEMQNVSAPSSPCARGYSTPRPLHIPMHVEFEKHGSLPPEGSMSFILSLPALPSPPLHLIWSSNFKFFKNNNYRKITMSQNILPRSTQSCITGNMMRISEPL